MILNQNWLKNVCVKVPPTGYSEILSNSKDQETFLDSGNINRNVIIKMQGYCVLIIKVFYTRTLFTHFHSQLWLYW